MKYIETSEGLEVGRQYWVKRKASNYPFIGNCIAGYGDKKRIRIGEGGDIMDADESAISVFKQCDIIGPLPVPVPPDFDEYKTAYFRSKKIF
jgi:hypothetical protein